MMMTMVWFFRPLRKRGERRAESISKVIHHFIVLVSINPQNHFKELPEVKLMDMEEEDILSHGLDFALGEDCSQLFQSFEIFDHDQLFSQPDNQPKNDLDKHNKSNNVVDQANLYLNLSNKMWANVKEDTRQEVNTNAELIQEQKLYRQTTLKTGHFTGANVTCADSQQKKNHKKLKSEFGHDCTVATNKRHKSFTSNNDKLYQALSMFQTIAFLT